MDPEKSPHVDSVEPIDGEESRPRHSSVRPGTPSTRSYARSDPVSDTRSAPGQREPDGSSTRSQRVVDVESLRSYHQIDPDGLDTGSSKEPTTKDYWETLIHYACPDADPPPPSVGRSERLYRLNLTYLFNELVKIKGEIKRDSTTTEDQMKKLGELLHRYTEAVRDYQYISSIPTLPDHISDKRTTALETHFPSLVNPNAIATASNGINRPPNSNRPYNVNYLDLSPTKNQAMDQIRGFLARILPRRISWTELEMDERQPEFSRGDVPRVYSRTLDRLARFLVGLLGGAWLIVPLLIMAFHQNLTKTLVTVCVSVVLFALAISLVLEMDNKDTVTATATYAAVLVVFVGTSTGAGS